MVDQPTELVYYIVYTEIERSDCMDIKKVYEYNNAYQKKMIRRVVVKLNKSTDKDILAKIDATDNVQGYIKSLIRADIAK